MPDNIYAHTAEGFEPEFISVNRTEAGIEFTIRSKGEGAATAEITLTREQATELHRALLRELVPTNAA